MVGDLTAGTSEGRGREGEKRGVMRRVLCALLLVCDLGVAIAADLDICDEETRAGKDEQVWLDVGPAHGDPGFLKVGNPESVTGSRQAVHDPVMSVDTRIMGRRAAL